jgi:primosomal protein N' (replication factor Y)
MGSDVLGTRQEVFHYDIPAGMHVLPGHLVWVPFGPRELPGIVVACSETSPVSETRPILAVIDSQPVITPYQVGLSIWMADYYQTSLHRVVWSMFPSELSWAPRLMIHLCDEALEGVSLKPAEQSIVQYLRESGPARLEQLERELGVKTLRPVVDRMVRKGWLRKESSIRGPEVRPKMETVIHLDTAPREQDWAALTKAPRQREVLSYLNEKGTNQGLPLEIGLSEVLRATGSTGSAVRGLQRRGLLRLSEMETRRDPLAGRDFVWSERPRFAPDQEAAWEEIEQALRGRESKVFLLHGVTGSGKTEIYLRALEQALGTGGQGIVLVPEIALTPQTIRRFAARFHERMAVLHSRLSPGERYDEWRRIRSGKADVVVGPRSALFAPLPRLKLIVVDEEHEWTYKQQEMPCYHARDVAVKLAELTGAVVILGSATPDVGSYYRAKRGEYSLLRLPRRIAGHEQSIRAHAQGDGTVPASAQSPGPHYMELPPVEVVDLKAELRAGNRSPFSRTLREGMEGALAAGQQVILFLNRRGSSSFVMCRDCGYVVKCPRCSVVLTYHGDRSDLLCHHCNYHLPVPARCPRCESERIRFFGIGTEKVAQLVHEQFPKARILRWDRDVTGGKDAHEQILDRFVAHEADVLVGTQMIAKGLDLPLVTLVGVITADTSLHLPDFRAGERTFQLLTQVAGRAGRSALGGRVIIQTYVPEHYCIQAASHHDYEGFYQEETEFRHQQGYPPFGRLVRLLFTHVSLERCEAESTRLEKMLRERIAREGIPAVDLIGPAPCFVERIRGRYRWHLVLRGSNPVSVLEGGNLPMGWQVDVDPVSLL